MRPATKLIEGRRESKSLGALSDQGVTRSQTPVTSGMGFCTVASALTTLPAAASGSRAGRAGDDAVHQLFITRVHSVEHLDQCQRTWGPAEAVSPL